MTSKAAVKTNGKPGSNSTLTHPVLIAHDSTTNPITPGFGPFSLQYLQFKNPKTGAVQNIPIDYKAGINNVIFQKTMMGVNTLTIQMSDPNRKLIQTVTRDAKGIVQGSGGVVGQGTIVTINEDGVQTNFTLVQFVKASDQIQMIFESEAVYRLRNARKQIGNKVGTAVTQFMHQQATQFNNPKKPAATDILFRGVDYATSWSKLSGNKGVKIVSIPYGVGTTTDKNEDSWTAMSRVASSAGWRLWEDLAYWNETVDGHKRVGWFHTVFFGPDEYWLGTLNPRNVVVAGKKVAYATPPINAMKAKSNNYPYTDPKFITTLKEFSDTVQLIDYDWDVGKPFAQATVTCMLDKWNFKLGEIVTISGLGPGSGNWMISGMQRDMFLPQASLTLQVPMPFASVFNPTSIWVNGFPLTAKVQ
jgi:hypothetical protein